MGWGGGEGAGGTRTGNKGYWRNLKSCVETHEEFVYLVTLDGWLRNVPRFMLCFSGVLVAFVTYDGKTQPLQGLKRSRKSNHLIELICV